MVQWNLTTAGKSPKWDYGFMPEQFNAWHDVYFEGLPRILAAGEMGAVNLSLFKRGCDNGDLHHLNCTATCSEPERMFKTPENFANCLTLASVALQVSLWRDTIDRSNENQTDYIFHFGSVKKFHEIPVFDNFHRCLRESCANSEQGNCTSEFSQFNASSRYNISDFQNLLDNYCEGSKVDLDSDIAGPGVLISYMVLEILVLFLGGLFLVVVVSVHHISQRTAYHRLKARAPKNRVAVALWRFAKRFPMAADSTILELQEAQILFTGTVYIATYSTFTNYTKVTENTLSLSAHAYNVFIIEALLSIGQWPAVALQTILHITRGRSGYSLLLFIVNLGLHATIFIYQHIESREQMEYLQRFSAIPACGNKPGPMSYCKPPISDMTWKLLYIAICLGFVACGFVVPLLLHWMGKFFGRPLLNFFGNYGIKLVLLGVFLSQGIIIFGFCALLFIYRDLYESGNEPATWSFGQLVAMTLWLPVISKFFYSWIYGIRKRENESD